LSPSKSPPRHSKSQINGEVKPVSPATVAVGDIILIHPGEKVPLDGEVIEGQAQMDTAALTGESLPRAVVVGETVLAGMINQSGSLTVRVTKPFGELSVARILELVENARTKKADTEQVHARADVGIAMGRLGSDATIETADVVIMTDAPTKVAEAISIARYTRRMFQQNIMLALLISKRLIHHAWPHWFGKSLGSSIC
jgi:cation transport ATPase